MTKSLILLAFSCFLLLAPSVSAQDLPKEIRGYKVQRAKISVINQSDKIGGGKSIEKTGAEAFVKISEPELAKISLTGMTFDLSAEIEVPDQSGRVDFLMFHDFRVNGLAVTVEEYQEQFEFRKNQTIVLPKPVKIFIGAGQTLRGALSEFQKSEAEWTVTGRIFVFGRFRKAGFNFKRVVPIEINLKIKNPLRKD